MADLIRIERCGAITKLTLERPDVRNALSSAVIEELLFIVKDLQIDTDSRAVIVTGSGNTFCAGADLKERQGMSEAETLAFVENIQRSFHEFSQLPMPTIAAINGNAFGGGLELALACDMRVMAKDAQVGLTECGLGIIPGAGGTQRLPRIVGVARAMELIFSARRLKAEEALAIGLINHVAQDAQDSLILAEKLAQQIAANAPLAVRAAKEAIAASLEKSLSEGLVAELASYHTILESFDRKEGLRAFAEKRPPRFEGR